MKKIGGILILLFILLSSAYADSALPFQADYEAINRVAQSMFLVEVIGKDGHPIKTGSGFVTFDDMFITNHHVIEDAASLIIHSDNYQHSFKLTTLLAVNKQADIAILSFPEGTNFDSLSLNPNSKILRGQPVTAIGSPEGVINSVSSGNISAHIAYSEGLSEIQFTAPISHGSSGGALFDHQGDVIGLIYASHTSGENMNYAIPISYVVDLKSTIKPDSAIKLSVYNNLADYFEAPENIEIQLNSDNQPELIWKNTPQVTSYKIYRLGSSGEFGMIGEIPAVKFESIKSFIDFNPRHGMDNCYSIRAVGNSSTSTYSDTVQIYVP